ncbi:Protein PEROXIN-4 [Porphyridium purpureum]|uniref:Protein PEROXIN-4 n=1 Tax=Porphyridium purpureum TaxID=35688 RepID=A0A5J4Z010_PORPP|nr:Protein PEROXIN-4 [Porphyridium purpureum]|eukprot:POR8556..scf208_2
MMSGRLMKEYRELQKEASQCSDPDIVLTPSENNFTSWRGRIKGPAGTPFENGHFMLDIMIPSSYPMSPPNIRFATKIFHPNVHAKTGEICLDILKTAWSPAWTLQSTCRAIIVLLSHPEADSPLNCDAGNLIRAGDARGFGSVARMYTMLYASK